MIYDRTQEDIENARRIIVEKVQKFYELSDDELETLERGTVTLDTVNRIAKKQDELLQLFISLGYYGGEFYHIEFGVGEIFNESDLNSLINRNEILRPIFYSYSSTPSRAKSEYTYTAFNDIERLLFDLENMYEFVVENIKECDTFDSGEE
jgi:hypothetical protein